PRPPPPPPLFPYTTLFRSRPPMADRRRLFADIAPLRDSADFRRLYVGQLVSFLGSQLTVVAVPYQVFLLTRSSFQVGLVSLAQLDRKSTRLNSSHLVISYA